ncbi:MAG: hypothetical protein ACRDN9_21070 [Streptosporangiaceae bacterium]
MPNRTDTTRWTPIVMALAGVLVFVAGQIHPRGPLSESFDTLESHLLADAGTWDATHAVLAVAIVVMTAGLYLLWRTDRIRSDPLLRAFTAVALAGILLSWLEMGFHIAMTSEAAALAGGGPTPLFDTHIVLQAVYTPLFGWGVAALALRGGWTGLWGNRWIGAVGVIGGVVFGLAGPVVAMFPESHDTLLFIGDAPLGIWAFLSGLHALWASRRVPVPAG